MPEHIIPMDDYGYELANKSQLTWVQYNSWFVSTATYGGFCDLYEDAEI